MMCPICRQPVGTNVGGYNLAIHPDKAGRVCPASGVTKTICQEVLP